MTSSSLLRNTLSGVTAAALAGSSLVVAGTAAKASSLDYDCFSRQTGTLIYKAAVDMTSLEIACVPGIQAVAPAPSQVIPVSYSQPVVVEQAPASSSAGEAFMGGVVGGILGGVIQGSMNQGHYGHGHHPGHCHRRHCHRGHHHRGRRHGHWGRHAGRIGRNPRTGAIVGNRGIQRVGINPRTGQRIR